MEDLAEQIGSLAAIRVIDDPEDLSAYGLDEPALQASVTAGDGTAVTLLLGDVSDSYCYAKRTDSDTVYTVSTDLPENLESLELLDLAAIPNFGRHSRLPRPGDGHHLLPHLGERRDHPHPDQDRN